MCPRRGDRWGRSEIPNKTAGGNTLEAIKEFDFFRDLLAESENSLIKKAEADGRIAIGYNCSMVPTPLLNVGNLFPVWMRAPEVTDTETGNFYLSPFNCSYTRSILQSAIEGYCDYLGGIVFAESCIHMDRCFDNIGVSKLGGNLKEKMRFMLPMPRKEFEPHMDILVDNLHKLTAELSERFGVDMSDDNIRASIVKHNEFVALLKQISDLRLADNPVITGTEWHTVFVACHVAPIDMLTEPLNKLLKALKKRKPDNDDLPRIMVIGTDLDDPAFTELFEKQGCRVVADRYCLGALPGLEMIPVEGDVYRNLAEFYVRTSQCPRMMTQYNERLQYMEKIAREYRADGIIFEAMKFCDLWGWEVLKAEPYAKNIGIPFMKIEREYHLTGEGQLRTRVQAFIERINNINVDQALSAKEESNG